MLKKAMFAALTLRNDRPDDLRGLCGGSIQTFRALPGGLGEQKDL